MTRKTEKLLMERLSEILSDEELAEFTDSTLFCEIWYAAEKGRPFALHLTRKQIEAVV